MSLPTRVRQAAAFLVALYACLLFAFLAIPDPTGVRALLVGLVVGVPIGGLAARRARGPRQVVRVALASLVVLAAVTVVVGLPALALSRTTGLATGAVFGSTAVTAAAVLGSVAAGYWLVVRGGLARLVLRRRGGD